MDLKNIVWSSANYHNSEAFHLEQKNSVWTIWDLVWVLGQARPRMFMEGTAFNPHRPLYIEVGVVDAGGNPIPLYRFPCFLTPTTESARAAD
jgi:hypothetical protein